MGNCKLWGEFTCSNLVMKWATADTGRKAFTVTQARMGFFSAGHVKSTASVIR